MPVKNSYIVHAFEIHETTGVGMLDKLKLDPRSLIAKQMFRIDAEHERWKPFFEKISTHLRDLRKLNGDLNRSWDPVRFKIENGPIKTQYESEISQITEKVYELCKILITTTQDSLMYKMLLSLFHSG